MRNRTKNNPMAPYPFRPNAPKRGASICAPFRAPHTCAEGCYPTYFGHGASIARVADEFRALEGTALCDSSAAPVRARTWPTATLHRPGKHVIFARGAPCTQSEVGEPPQLRYRTRNTLQSGRELARGRAAAHGHAHLAARPAHPTQPSHHFPPRLPHPFRPRRIQRAPRRCIPSAATCRPWRLKSRASERAARRRATLHTPTKSFFLARG